MLARRNLAHLRGAARNLAQSPVRRVPATGYSLSDTGANAAAFGMERLPLIGGIYGTYTFTGAARSLIALPKKIDAAPGLVPFAEGQTRVCAFGISEITPGVIPDFNFGLYNPSGSVLFNVKVEVDDGATTGRIRLEYGTYPGSMTTHTAHYEGDLVGAGITLALTYASGQVTCTMYVFGTYLNGGNPIATSPAISATGGVFAEILVTDEVGASGSITVEINPSVPVLSDNFGNFPAGSVDMDGTAIVPSGIFSPLSLAGTLELWHWRDKSKLWTTYIRDVNVAAVTDPVGAWRGYLNKKVLETVTSSARLEYGADGVLVNAASVYKELYLVYSATATAPITILMRYVGSSGHNPRVGAYAGAQLQSGFVNGADISGRARLGTLVSSGVSAPGDHCVVVSFNGTTAYMKVDGGATVTLTPGGSTSAIDTLKLAGLVPGLCVSEVKYLQVVAGAVSAADAAKWNTWASAQP